MSASLSERLRKALAFDVKWAEMIAREKRGQTETREAMKHSLADRIKRACFFSISDMHKKLDPLHDCLIECVECLAMGETRYRFMDHNGNECVGDYAEEVLLKLEKLIGGGE
jgi:hypothetical protein